MGLKSIASLALLLIAATATQTAGALSPEYRVGNLRVTAGWARPTAPTMTVGVVYFSITNSGNTPDRLLAVQSPAADKAELHQTTMVHGVMQMRQVESVQCPPNKTIKSEPGGLHVMLLGLTRPLLAGMSIPVTLSFRFAGAVTLQIPIETRE